MAIAQTNHSPGQPERPGLGWVSASRRSLSLAGLNDLVQNALIFRSLESGMRG